MTSERSPEGGRLATPSQRLLLHAALLEGEPALDAWREWDRREVIEELDRASDGWSGCSGATWTRTASSTTRCRS